MAEDIIRVLRVLEYVGPRSEIESLLKISIQGSKTYGRVEIKAATIGLVPDIIEMGKVENLLPSVAAPRVYSK